MMPDRVAEMATFAEGEKNVRAFLKVIRWAEFYPHGNLGSDYRRRYGGSELKDLKDHPMDQTERWGKKSSASGAYMITKETWVEYQKKLGLTDFSADSQDRVAIAIIKQVKAYDLIREGKVEDALKKLNKRWSSLPGGSQQQAGVTLDKTLEQFRAYRAEEP
ncbi:Muramidase (phage lambda lysozyme) [Singulisphaera sp. GP187]|uniref:glycoside hydrolase family 24 protein n=1 Tax=Singulisphaera sp. GP187 TaxID=1882752 RepID=UPI0009264A6A|nr:glycoside hydrolase family 104 protein [Singulisphaera sp. GP187]SIN80731.1 Muramidase (phage lambda lysozyme) [Singulisphaera sp. GP187]